MKLDLCIMYRLERCIGELEINQMEYSLKKDPEPALDNEVEEQQYRSN